MARWWLWHEYPFRPGGPPQGGGGSGPPPEPPPGPQLIIDLWLGGPNADGRGLDAANGGYGPAQGLTIVSPSSSTPSSSARFLVRAADGTWRDKQAGVLAGIGGRVWTGGWTYTGAANVTCLGPLPALSTHDVTDTVRRYTSTSGRAVQDAAGGIVQSYCQQCDVAEGEYGGGWGCWPCEIVPTVDAADQVYWHGIVETTAPQLFAPAFGAYSDSGGFFDGILGFSTPLSVEQNSSSGQFSWRVRHLGTGPRGGLLIEYLVVEQLTQSKTTVGLFAYLLRAHGSTSARTLYIHQHSAHHLKSSVARMHDFPTAILVAAGSVASLVKEDLAFGGEQTNVSLIARLDLRNYGMNNNGYRVLAYTADDVYTPMHLLANTFGAYPPSFTYGTLTANVLTLTTTVTSARLCTGYRDDVPVGQDTMQSPASSSPGYRIGRLDAADARLPAVPIRRIQIFDGVLGATEVAAAHAAIVAAEG